MSALEVLLQGALAISAGVAVGWAHFRGLRALVDRIAAGDPRALALQGARLAVLGGFLFLCAWIGAFVLLAATAGVFVGRSIVIRAARGEDR